MSGPEPQERIWECLGLDCFGEAWASRLRQERLWEGWGLDCFGDAWALRFRQERLGAGLGLDVEARKDFGMLGAVFLAGDMFRPVVMHPSERYRYSQHGYSQPHPTPPPPKKTPGNSRRTRVRLT